MKIQKYSVLSICVIPYLTSFFSASTSCLPNSRELEPVQQRQQQEEMSSLINIAKQCYREEMDKHTATVHALDAAELRSHHDMAVAVVTRRVSGTMFSHKNTIAQSTSVLQDIFHHIDLINAKKRTAGKAIGIDFGTTLCCVAVCKEPHRPEIIPNDNDNNKTPSYVAFLDILSNENDPEVACGETAKQQASSNPKGTIFDVKRMLGQRVSSSVIQQCIKYWPFDVVSENDQILVKPGRTTQQTFTPVQITAYLLRHLVKLAEEFLESPVVNAVIAVPVEFSAHQEMLIRDACELAHLNILKLVHEPTAASVAYNNVRQNNTLVESTHCIIIDFGGGTFDVAVLQIHEHRVQILETGGDNCLGGNLIDTNMAEYCIAIFKENRGVDLKKQQTAQDLATAETVSKYLRQLIVKCEDHKKVLSLKTKTLIYMDEILGAQSLSVSMTKEEFYSINADIFEKGIHIISKVLTDCDINKLAVDEVVLVGGSSRIPVFRQMIKDFFQKEPLLKSVRVDEAVAAGAAILASEAFDLSVPSVLVPKLTQSRSQNLEPASSLQLPAAALPPKTARWGNQIKDYPPRERHAAVAVGGYIYSFGGSSYGDPSYSRHLLDVLVLNVNEVQKAWKKLPVENSEVNPTQRHGHSAVAHKEFVLIFGGWDIKKRELSNSTCLFNTQTRTWNKPKVTGNVPAARYNHTAVVFRNEMLIHGGNGFGVTNELLSLHLESFRWSTIETKGIPPSFRFGHSATLHSDRFILIFGGYDYKEKKVVNTIDSFDLHNKTWTVVETRGTPSSSRRDHCAFVHSGRIYIFGGWYGNYFNDVFMYDSETFEWKEVTPIGEAPSPRQSAACVALDDQVFIFGGSNLKEPYLGDTHVLYL